MPLTHRQRTVLLGLLEDQRDLADMPTDVGSRLDRGRHRIAVRNAQNGLVPMNLPGWLGRAPTNSDHVLFHREYLRLEGMGLIQRVSLTGGRRTTHLRLTPAGLRMAEALWAEEYGCEADEDIDWSNVEFEPIILPVDASEGGGSEDG
jgi:hypothetical protein